MKDYNKLLNELMIEFDEEDKLDKFDEEDKLDNSNEELNNISKINELMLTIEEIKKDLNKNPLSSSNRFNNIYKNIFNENQNPKDIENNKDKEITINKSNVDRAFDLSVINLDCNYPIKKILDGIVNFSEQLKNNTNKVKNCCILFSGNSGCGKTEFAKYIASISGLPYIHIRASDLINCWIGETEKKIAEIFKKASDNKSILIIDEADSFLRDRSLSTKSWEVTQVNEFLCRMEEFKGILICSSNLLSNFDKASMRRFVFKIKFKDLTEEGKETLAKKYFNEICNLPNDLIEIKQIKDLRPGDFKSVRDRMLIIHKDKIPFSELLEELKIETNYRKQENLINTL